MSMMICPNCTKFFNTDFMDVCPSCGHDPNKQESEKND